jgi:ribosomal protein S18 acetylase RimI-like enzyme
MILNTLDFSNMTTISASFPPNTHTLVRVLPSSYEPSSPEFSRDAVRLRELRLLALQTAADAFASPYAKEAAWGPEVWQDQLTNAEARIFVATVAVGNTGARGSTGVASGLQGGEEQGGAVEERPWVGTATLHGPVDISPVEGEASLPRRALTVIKRDVPHSSEGQQTYFLNGMFVHPSVQGRGVGKALLDAVDELTRSRLSETGVKTITLLVDDTNGPAKRLYEKAGYAEVGRGDYSVAVGSPGPRIGLRLEKQVSGG